MRCYFEKTSTGTCHSVIPSLREDRKEQSLLNFLMLQLTFLQEYEAQFFHSSLNQKRSTCKRVLVWKIAGFVCCVTIPIVRKFWKMPWLLIYRVIQTDFSQQLQVWVHQSKSPLKASLLFGGLDWKSMDIDLCIKILIVQNFQRVVTKNDWFRWSHYSLRNYIFDFFL